MKFIIAVFGAILLIIAMGILVLQVQKKETDVTVHTTKVAMIMNGPRDDHSWSEAHVIAMEKVAKKLNLDVSYYENTVESDSAAYEMESAIANGAQIVIATSFGFGNAILNVAEKHPDLKFMHATGINQRQNLSSFFGRIYQMRYLSGIVAGLVTKTNEIGYVAAMDISEVNRGINAFTLGVQKVNPNAKVYVSWSHDWVDSAMAAMATESLIAKHNIDVLTVHTDALSPYEIAEAKGIRMIGYNVDNGARFPKSFLTAPIWRWEKYYEPHIMAVLQNKFVGDHTWDGIESGILDLAPMTVLVPDSVKEIVESEKERLLSGSFDVFYGPIEDNQGKLRVDDGESMTDADMLEHFDWYVKGVVNE